MNMLNLPKKVYFKRGSMNVALKELDEVYGLKRAFIISDANLYRSGIVAPVNDWLRNRNIRCAEFFTLSEVPSFADVKSGLPKMLEFEPDVIVAVGGGSVISAAKAMWLQYENPEVDLADVAAKFGKLTGTDVGFPTTGKKAKLVAVATTFGTGAQNSPFAVLSDDAGKKVVIASYTLLPEISVTDAIFADNMSAELIKKSGAALLSQVIRAFADPGSNAYTQGILAEAAKGVVENIEAAVNGCPVAIDKLANAGAIAGYAVGNAVQTIDPDAELYPTAKEKGAKDPAVDALAKLIGLADGGALIAACEKIAAL
jgi:acetaldehyde dehydrogenase/alcohol dehydrogenase